MRTHRWSRESFNANPEALVRLLRHKGVRLAATDVVAPHLEGTPRLVHARVEEPVRTGPGAAATDAGERTVHDRPRWQGR